MESNFAALTLPEEILNPNENNNNQVTIFNNNKNVVIVSRRVYQPSQKTSRLRSVFQDHNFNLKISRLIKYPRNQEIREVYEIVFPVSRNPSPDNQSFVMSSQKFLEDSHEPMEIEEISFTESTKVAEPFLHNAKHSEDVEIIEVIRPKKILRESKLSKIFKEEKVAGPEVDGRDLPNDEKKTEVEDSEVKKSETTQKTKTRLRPLVEKAEDRRGEKDEKSTFFYFWQMLFFILFPIAVIVVSVTIAREEFDSDVCAHRFSANQAIRDLKNRVFGQTEAIEELGDHLELNSSAFRILILIGGTGVGKSYAAHIISENFSAKKNVFQYVQPLKPRRRFALGVVSICGCNLIIIENLNNRDIDESVDFVEHLSKKINNENYCVLIIKVINVQETDVDLKHEVNLSKSKQNIENIYRNKNLNVQIIQFKPLDDEIIKKCIIDEAESINLKLSESQIEDVKISLKNAGSGCKGARARVHLLDKKWI